MLFGLLYGLNGKRFHRSKLEILLVFITKKKETERERETNPLHSGGKRSVRSLNF